MAIRALKVFELLKQKLENYATVEGNPSRKEIQLAERIIFMINLMNNENQFEFDVIEDIHTDVIFDPDKVDNESIYKEEECLTSNEAFVSLEYAQRVVEACKKHPQWSCNTIKARFSKINPAYLNRCKKYVEQQGTCREK